MAQSYARRGKHVLLIDGDLRKPAFTTPEQNGGLTGLLTDTATAGEVTVPTAIHNLQLLPAGPRPPNPADLLSTSRFSEVIGGACASFDVVVVDAPPVLGLSDAPLMAQACGTVLFVVESGKTRTAAARDALRAIRASGAHVLGATLTKMAEAASHYGYGYGYGKQAIENRNEIPLVESAINT